MPTIARLIQTVDGQLVQSEFPLETCIPAMEVRGYEFVRLNDNPRHRAELQGAPVFRGVAGPCYDGPGVIRYEDAEANKRLST